MLPPTISASFKFCQTQITLQGQRLANSVKGVFVVQVPPAQLSHQVSIAAEVTPIPSALPQLHVHIHMHLPAPVTVPTVPLLPNIEPAVTSSSPMSAHGAPSGAPSKLICPELVYNPLFASGSDSKVCAHYIYSQGAILIYRHTMCFYVGSEVFLFASSA